MLSNFGKAMIQPKYVKIPRSYRRSRLTRKEQTRELDMVGRVTRKQHARKRL